MQNTRDPVLLPDAQLNLRGHRSSHPNRQGMVGRSR